MGASTLIPALGWLRQYPSAWLRPDVTAGLTAAAVVVPKAMAYATIAGLPLQVGLYTAMVPMVVYGLLGTSRPLSVSTTTTIAILTAAEIGRSAPGGDAAALIGAAATLSVLVGILLTLASLLRLGFIANFISEPVLTGFKSGIGLVIVVDQLPKLLGVHFEKTGFFRDLFALTQQLPDTSVPTLLLGVVLLAMLVGLEHFVPKVPAPLVAIAVAIAASGLLGLDAAGVATVGHVAGGLPTLMLPHVELAEAMWPAAAGIALMSFTETIAAARAFGAPGEPRPNANQELLALGVANAAGGLLGAMPAGGGTSQTAVNRLAGARTQVAELVTAAAATATLLLLGPVIALMPQAALAAVVVVYSLELIKPAEFAAIRRVRGTELLWAATAFAGVVLLGTLKGILVAVVVSLLSLAQQAYNPPVYALGRKRGTTVFRARTAEHDDETWPGLLILRTEGRLFFANADSVADRMLALVEEARPRVLVLDCRAIFDIEYTALKTLVETDDKLQAQGVTVWLAGLNPDVLKVVRRSPFGERLGRERMFFNLDGAVQSSNASKPRPQYLRPLRPSTRPTVKNKDKKNEKVEGKNKKAKGKRQEAEGPKAEVSNAVGALNASARRPDGDAQAKDKLSGKQYAKELTKLHVELVKLQEWVKFKGLKICIVFEGRDGAGKGGTIKAITERVSPRVFRVIALPSPSEREKSQMYGQRFLPHLPAAGEVVIWDRSWYNRAGVERVMGFCTESQALAFLKVIPLFEKLMVDSGIILLKYWLEVSEEEQTRRLKARIDDGRKIWKLSPMDLKSYSRWYDYSRARDDMFTATDTGYAPWWVIHSDDKQRARLNIISHLLEQIPYESAPREKVKLPKRQKAKGYRDPNYAYKKVPEKY